MCMHFHSFCQELNGFANLIYISCFLSSGRYSSIIFLILVRGKGRWRRMSGGSAGKESACNTGDLGSIPGLGRSPGEGKDYPLQYSCLENPMDCVIHGVAKSRTQLSDFHFHFWQFGSVVASLSFFCRFMKCMEFAFTFSVFPALVILLVFTLVFFLFILLMGVKSVSWLPPIVVFSLHLAFSLNNNMVKTTRCSLY